MIFLSIAACASSFSTFCPPVYGFLLCMLLGRFRVGGSEHLRFPLRVCFCVAFSVCRVECRCWNIAQWACFNEHSRAVSCHPSLPLANPNHSTMQSVLREWPFLLFFFFLLALLCATKETRSHNVLLHLIEGRVFNNYLVSMSCVTLSPSQQGEREFKIQLRRPTFSGFLCVINLGQDMLKRLTLFFSFFKKLFCFKTL